MEAAFWDQRYSPEEFAYGVEANAYLAAVLSSLPPGRLLLPGEGEGRNAVFAARLKWDVLAVDFSETARRKALRLASESDVSVEYIVERLEEYLPPLEVFDAVGLIFVHLPPSFRSVVHRRCADALRPGGIVMLEAFTPEQLRFSSGGPRDPGLLYTSDALKDDFSDLDIVSLQESTVVLREGKYHDGEAAVVRMLARKSLV
jgi:SAM-dependent methyltransferase